MNKTLTKLTINGRHYQFLALPGTEVFKIETVNFIGSNVEHYMEKTEPELGSLYGASHLIEHLGFRATKDFTSEALMRELNTVNYNASTDHPRINYWIKSVAGDMKKSINLVFNITYNTLHRIPQDEFELERKVVVNEINQYADDNQSMFHFTAHLGAMVDVDGNPVSTKHNILGEADDVAVLTLDTLIDLKKQMLAGSEQCINVTYDPQCTGVDEIVMMIEAEIARYDIPEYSPALRVAIESCLPTLGTNDDVYVGAYGDQSMTNILIPSVENTYKLASLAAGYLGRRATTSMNDLIREKHGLTYGIHFYHTLTFNKNYDSFVCDVSPGDEALLLSLITESIDASVAGFTSEKWDGVLQTIRNERILANMNLNSYDDLIVTGYMHPTVYAGYADVFEVNIDAAIESIYTDEYTFENIRDGIENIQANYQNKTIIRSWE